MTADEVRKIAACAEKVGAKRIRINTVCRPAAEDCACAVFGKQLEKLAAFGQTEKKKT